MDFVVVDAYEDLAKEVLAGHETVLDKVTVFNVGPEYQNIDGAASGAIIGYNQETFTPISAQSTTNLLLAFDRRTNSEIAIGWTRNSVYNSIAKGNAQYINTYYPIGDPPIMVTVNTNGVDPLGEFWKCSHGSFSATMGMTDEEAQAFSETPGYSAAMNNKNVIIQTTDGVKYCMPLSRATYRGTGRKTKMDAWARDLYGQPNFISPGHDARDPLTGEFKTSSAFGKAEYRVLVYDDWASDALASDAVLSYDVPFDSALIDSLENVPGTPATSEATSLAFFKESRLISLYRDRQVPRENEFQVTYNVVEKEALQARFGQVRDLSATLNGLYINMAYFLATTFIETAYTFKKVEMQQLTPEQITPSNLAMAAGTNVILNKARMEDLPYSTEGYYPSDYVDTYSGESYREPTPPAGGFYDEDYYMMMSAATMSLPLEESATPADVIDDLSIDLAPGGGMGGGGGSY